MKVLIVLSLAVALATAVPQRNLIEDEQKPAEEIVTVIPIIRLDKEQSADGSYKSAYETGNNIRAQEEGYLQEGADAESIPSLVQRGTYSYIAPNGEVIEASYIADKNGFRIEGAHVPTLPPVSPEIQKSLDLIYAGIEANKLRDELERQNNPEAALKQDEKAALNYKGLYYSQ